MRCSPSEDLSMLRSVIDDADVTANLDAILARPGKRPRPGRRVERAGVRAVIALLEDADMAVQEVDLRNDIGKDLYVDLHENGVFRGEMIAIQVKSGVSYRDRSGGHRIPASRDDRALWAGSSVPVFGVVFDPSDKRMYWANLTAWARTQPTHEAASSVRCSSWTLDAHSLASFVTEARTWLAAIGQPTMLGLADNDPQRQVDAVYDAFALGRRDPRPLLLVRRSVMALAEPALALAVRVFNLLLPLSHGDIYWHPGNWIDPAVRSELTPHLTDWRYEEACRLLALPDVEEWNRGSLGQDVAWLIGSGWGPDVADLLKKVASRATFDVAWPALMMLVDGSEDALGVLEEVVRDSPALRGKPEVLELEGVLHEYGSVSMW
jgi:hypothetical protein